MVLLKDEQSGREPVALLSANTELSEEQIILYFIRRRSMEVTFGEGRAHPGVETRRQWSDRAVNCTTPALMGLFSIVALWADKLQQSGSLQAEQCAWHKKELPAFCDALAAVRKEIWHGRNFCTPEEKEDMMKIPKRVLNELTTMLCNAA